MPANNLDSALAGFLVHDPLITAATLRPSVASPTAADSDFTEAGPVPGIATYQRGDIAYSSATAGDLGPQLSVQMLGAQDSPVAIRAQRAGMPGIGGLEVAARLRLGDSADDDCWFGWETPQVVGQTSVAALNRSGNLPRNFDAVDLMDGRAYIVWNESGVLYGRTYNADDHDWESAAVTIADYLLDMDEDGAQQATGSTYDPIAIMRTDSGRLIVAALGVGPDALSSAAATDLILHYSDDDGATWRSSTLTGYDEPLPYVLDREYTCVVLAYYQGTALLLVGYQDVDEEDEPTAWNWAQYASSSDGVDFNLVEDGGVSGNPGRPHITVSLDGTFIVSYVDYDGSSFYWVYCRRIRSPYIPLSSVDAVEVDSVGIARIDDTTGWVAPDGTVHVAWAFGDRVQVARSLDAGASWQTFSTALAHTPGQTLAYCQAVTMNSRVLWLMNGGARPGQHLILIESGGWSMVPMPRITSEHPAELRGFGGSASYTDTATWWPSWDPTSVGYTLTGTAGTLTPSGAWAMSWTSASGYYSRGYGSHSASAGATVHFECEIPSGVTGYGTLRRGLQVYVGNGTEDIRAEVRMTSIGVGLYDVNAAALITSGALDCTERRIYRLGLQHGGGNTVALYSRLHDGDRWEMVATGVATRRTSGGGTSSVTFGNFVSEDSTWYGVHVTIGDGGGNHVATTDALSAGLVIDQTPDTLPGAPMPVAPGRLHLEDGLYTRARGGPGLRGDWWLTETGYRWAIGHMLTRSPEEQHRSTADGVADRVLWEPNPGYEHHPGGHAVGLHVTGANTRYVRLLGSDGTTVTIIATLDLADGTTGLAYSRTGDTVRVASGATTAPYMTALSLVGGTVDLGSSKLRKIQRATGGVWRDGSYTVTLQLAGIDGTEPTSGTLDLWRPTGTVAVLGYQTAHRYWGIARPSQSTADGYYSVGRVVIGQVVIMGQRWGNGRTTTTTPNVIVQALPGATAARRTAAAQRTIAVAWPEGVPLNYGDDPAYQTAGGVPVAMVGDVSALERLTVDIGEAVEPVVLLPAIEHDPAAVSAEAVQIVGRDLNVYGTLRESFQAENVYGDEVTCEHVRYTGVVLVEEV